MKKIITILLGICLMTLAIPNIPAKAEEVSPKLVIESYTVDSNYELGGDTTVKLVLKNMSDTYTMTDIILSYSSDNTVIPSLGTSNQVYIAKIEPGKTAEVTLNVAVVAATNGYAKLMFATNYGYGADVTYVDADEKEVTAYATLGSYSNSSSYIMFPVATSGSFTVSSVNVANTANVGAKAIVGVKYSNPGKDDVKNVKMILSYEGKEESISLGDVKAGTSSYLEHYVSFANVGAQTVSVAFQYENSAGKTETLTYGTYAVEVKAVVVPATPTPATSGETGAASMLSDSTFTIILVVIGVIVVSGLFGLISVKRKK